MIERSDAPRRMCHRDILHCLSSTSTTGPSPRFGHTAVVLGNKMILFGGRDIRFHSDTWAYDFMQRAWSQIIHDGLVHTIHQGPMPRAGHTAIVTKAQTMVVFGGVFSQCGMCTNDVWELACGLWSKISKGSSAHGADEQVVPSGRRGHTAVVFHGDIMVIFGGCGGATMPNGDGAVWLFDTRSGSWSELSCTGTSPAPRMYHISEVTKQQSMLVFGGKCAQHDVFFNDLYELHLSSASWRKVEVTGSVPSQRMCSSSLIRNDVLCIFHGGSTTYHPDSYEYNLYTSEWRRIDVADSSGFMVPCTRPTTVAHNNKVMMFGGCGQHNQYLNRAMEVTFAPPTLKELCRQWFLPTKVTPTENDTLNATVRMYLTSRD